MRLIVLMLLALTWANTANAQSRCDRGVTGKTYLVKLKLTCAEKTQGHLLEGFDLSFQNGDHKPHMIVVAHGTAALNILLARTPAGLRRTYVGTSQAMYAGMNDQNGGDEFKATVAANPMGWRAVRAYPVHETTLHNCAKSCSVRLIHAWGEDEIAILRGFAFLRHPDVDNNLRSLYLTLPETCDGNTCIARAGFEDDDPKEPFSVLIQYSIIPKSIVKFERKVRSAQTERVEIRSDRIANGFRDSTVAVAMTHFYFEFLGDVSYLRRAGPDRFLGRIKVMPDRDNRYTRVMMRDGDNDNTFNPLYYSIGLVGLDRAAISP